MLRPAAHGPAIVAVMRHELRSLFYAPTCYLFLTGFLVVLSACVFVIADFYATDEASLRLLLLFLPWVAMILVPALAMGQWASQGAGQGADRSVELALTLPVGPAALVIGKFLAGFAVLLVALLLTFPFTMTIVYLGEPDAGLLFSGYLGSALLLGASFAIALLCAALIREPVGAFVLSVASLFLLQLLGWDALGHALRDAIPARVLEWLALCSPNTWLRRMGQGWIDWAGLAYFAGVGCAALFAAALVVGGWRAGRSPSKRFLRGTAIGLGLLAVVLVPVAILSRSSLGLDLTAEREFTPHDGTLRILERLPNLTEISLYWSASESSVPASINSHARRARNLILTLAARSDGRLRIREIDPQPDSDEEIQAQQAGLRRIPMSSGDHFFLGLTAGQGGRSTSIAYLDPRRERLLEYDIALALNNLARERPPRLGVISPLLPSSVAEGRREGLSFMEELKRAYDIAVIPHFKETLPDGLDALLVIDATILRSEMLYAIDQFVMAGGGLLVMLDPFVRFNRTSNAVNPSTGPDVNDISDLLQRYGIRYRGEAVVGDGTLASPVAAADQTQMSFPFWLRIGPDGLSEGHPATADLNEIFFVEPGALEVLSGERGRALVTTTAESGGLPREGYGAKTPGELARDFSPDGRSRTLVAALRGPFISAYRDDPDQAGKAGYRASSDGMRQIFAVADVDWIFDSFSLQRTEIGGRSVVRPLNDNLSLLLNLVEYASGDPALVEIRSRGRLQRPFIRVAAMFKQAEGRLRAEEAVLSRKGAELEARLAQAAQASDVTAVEQLPTAVQDDLREIYGELVEVRRGLRAVRHEIRSDIDRLGRRITIINLLAGPLLVAALALCLAWWRRRARSS